MNKQSLSLSICFLWSCHALSAMTHKQEAQKCILQPPCLCRIVIDEEKEREYRLKNQIILITSANSNSESQNGLPYLRRVVAYTLSFFPIKFHHKKYKLGNPPV